MIKKLLITPVLICFLSTFSVFPSIEHTINSGKEFIASNLVLQDIAQGAPEFTISPNPATSKLNIKLAKINEQTTLSVYDVLGKRILQKELEELNTTLDVSRWNNGIYLVRITSDKQTQTKRFVKQ